MCELGWKSLGVLELTALPSIDEEQWVPLVQQTDVLLVGGGDALYLAHWMRQSGLVDLLPSLPETVWVGVSAGSLVMGGLKSVRNQIPRKSTRLRRAPLPDHPPAFWTPPFRRSK